MLLKNKIKKWISEGFINAEQGEAILSYENASKSNSSSWILYGFLMVAVFSTGLGLIALIAANWRIIPPFLKLAGYFLLLGSTAFFTLKFKFDSQNTKQNKVWFEPLLVFFMILCLAGIGLISQIYNIKGESYQALLFWSLITSGLMILSRKGLTMYIWLGGLYMALIGWLLEIVDDSLYFKITLLHPLFFLVLAMLFHNKKLITAVPGLLSKRKVLEEWALFTSFISLAFFHVSSYQMGFSVSEFFFLGLLFLGSVGSIFLSDYKKIQKYLLSSILCLFFLFYFFLFSLKLNSLVLMAFSSLVLALFAFFFATLKKINLFMFFVVALILRILFFYINIFKSLTWTGLILLVLGFIIVLSIQFVKKNKEELTQWLESLE